MIEYLAANLDSVIGVSIGAAVPAVGLRRWGVLAALLLDRLKKIVRVIVNGTRKTVAHAKRDPAMYLAFMLSATFMVGQTSMPAGQASAMFWLAQALVFIAGRRWVDINPTRTIIDGLEAAA